MIKYENRKNTELQMYCKDTFGNRLFFASDSIKRTCVLSKTSVMFEPLIYNLLSTFFFQQREQKGFTVESVITCKTWLLCYNHPNNHQNTKPNPKKLMRTRVWLQTELNILLEHFCAVQRAVKKQYIYNLSATFTFVLLVVKSGSFHIRESTEPAVKPLWLKEQKKF